MGQWLSLWAVRQVLHCTVGACHLSSTLPEKSSKSLSCAGSLDLLVNRTVQLNWLSFWGVRQLSHCTGVALHLFHTLPQQSSNCPFPTRSVGQSHVANPEWIYCCMRAC